MYKFTRNNLWYIASRLSKVAKTPKDKTYYLAALQAIKNNKRWGHVQFNDKVTMNVMLYSFHGKGLAASTITTIHYLIDTLHSSKNVNRAIDCIQKGTNKRPKQNSHSNFSFAEDDFFRYAKKNCNDDGEFSSRDAFFWIEKRFNVTITPNERKRFRDYILRERFVVKSGLPSNNLILIRCMESANQNNVCHSDDYKINDENDDDIEWLQHDNHNTMKDYVHCPACTLLNPPLFLVCSCCGTAMLKDMYK